MHISSVSSKRKFLSSYISRILQIFREYPDTVPALFCYASVRIIYLYADLPFFIKQRPFKYTVRTQPVISAAYRLYGFRAHVQLIFIAVVYKIIIAKSGVLIEFSCHSFLRFCVMRANNIFFSLFLFYQAQCLIKSIFVL